MYSRSWKKLVLGICLVVCLVNIFNVEKVFSQDVAIYLDKYNICVRAGNHCAKMLKDDLNIKNTCRVSMYIYNTVEDVDRLLEALRNSKDIFKIVI